MLLPSFLNRRFVKRKIPASTKIHLKLLESRELLNATFQTLGDFPGGYHNSYAHDVSGDGTVVVGFGNIADGVVAFRWTNSDGLINLDSLDNTTGSFFKSAAFGVSDNNDVLVGSIRSTGFDRAPVRWTATDGFVKLGLLPGDKTGQASDVSADGSVIVGTSNTFPVRWTDSQGVVQLKDRTGLKLNGEAAAASADGSVIVGGAEFVSGPYRTAFRWTASEGLVNLGTLPGLTSGSQSLAVSADGSIIAGVSLLSGGKVEAFRWTAATGMTGLGDLPGGLFSSEAKAMTPDGSIIIGTASEDPGTQPNPSLNRGNAAFVWDANTGMRSLQDILAGQGVVLSGWRLVESTGISNDGRTIVGAAMNPVGDREAFIVHLDRSISDTLSIFGTKTVANTQSTIGLNVVQSVNPMPYVRVSGIANGSVFLHDGTTSIAEGEFITAEQAAAGLKFTPLNSIASPQFSFGFDVQASASTTEDGLTGNVAHATVTVNDVIAPNTTILSGPSAITSDRTANIAFTGTDDVSAASELTFQGQLDTGTFGVVTSPITFSNLADGPHIFRVWATDAAGNMDHVGAEFKWIVDTTPPTVSIGAPSHAYSTFNDSTSYEVTFSDTNLNSLSVADSAISLITTGGVTATKTVTLTGPRTVQVTLTNISGNGTVGISVAAGAVSDKAGNQSTASGTSATIVADNTPPVVTIGKPSSSSIQGGSITYKVAVTDTNLSDFNLTADQVQFTSLTGQLAANITVAAGPESNEFTITVSKIRGGAGTFRIELPASLAKDFAGQTSDAPTSGDIVTVTPIRKLAILIAPPPTRVKRGSSYGYTISVANTGTQFISASFLIVTTPAGAIFNAAISSSGWTSLGHGKYRFNIGDIDVHARGRVIFGVTFPKSPPKSGLASLTAAIYEISESTRPFDVKKVDSGYDRFN